MTTANWIHELPTVEECEKEIARLSYWLETKRYEMTPREAVKIGERISSWEVKKRWARRFGKTNTW
jgi:hypothetical protein